MQRIANPSSGQTDARVQVPVSPPDIKKTAFTGLFFILYFLKHCLYTIISR